MTEDPWWVQDAKRLGLEVSPLRFVTQLPDGGQVEATDRTIVPMGDAFAHRELTYTHDGDDDRPACRIVFQVRDRVPACVKVELIAGDEISIRTTDLTAIKLERLRSEAFAYGGVLHRTAEGEYVRRFSPAGLESGRKTAVRATSRRRKITQEFLGRVAEVHNGAPEGGRLDAVMGAFHVAERQALRYIALARQEEGLINDG